MTRSTARAPRSATALVTALLLAFAAAIVPAAAASAHDQLIATDPAAGSTVEALPAEITLTYSAELLGGDGANQVQVTDAAGTVLSDAPPVTDGANVVQTLTGTATGEITVLWRVVSSDGHPISGEFAFTVAGAPAPDPTSPAPVTPTDAAPTPPATATASPPATGEASPSPGPSTEDAAASPLPWIILGVVVAAVIAAIAYLLVSRARRGKAPDAPEPGREG